MLRIDVWTAADMFSTIGHIKSPFLDIGNFDQDKGCLYNSIYVCQRLIMSMCVFMYLCVCVLVTCAGVFTSWDKPISINKVVIVRYNILTIVFWPALFFRKINSPDNKGNHCTRTYNINKRLKACIGLKQCQKCI